MTDWKEVSDQADAAYADVDSSHKALDAEINVMYTVALADDIYSPAEKEAIGQKRSQAMDLLTERDNISSAALEALDDNKDVASLKSMFADIKQNLEQIGSELDTASEATNGIDSAVSTIGEILDVIG
jgi:hypothetical protein